MVDKTTMRPFVKILSPLAILYAQSVYDWRAKKQNENKNAGWLLVQNVDSQSIMQKHLSYSAVLQQKYVAVSMNSDIARLSANPAAQFQKKVQRCWTKCTKTFNCNWLKNKLFIEDRVEYFTVLLEAAISASVPPSVTALSMEEAADGLTTVTSQITKRPPVRW